MSPQQQKKQDLEGSECFAALKIHLIVNFLFDGGVNELILKNLSFPVFFICLFTLLNSVNQSLFSQTLLKVLMYYFTRGISLLESWVTTFLPN